LVFEGLRPTCYTLRRFYGLPRNNYNWYIPTAAKKLAIGVYKRSRDAWNGGRKFDINGSNFRKNGYRL